MVLMFQRETSYSSSSEGKDSSKDSLTGERLSELDAKIGCESWLVITGGIDAMREDGVFCLDLGQTCMSLATSLNTFNPSPMRLLAFQIRGSLGLIHTDAFVTRGCIRLTWT